MVPWNFLGARSLLFELDMECCQIRRGQKLAVFSADPGFAFAARLILLIFPQGQTLFPHHLFLFESRASQSIYLESRAMRLLAKL